MSEYAPGVESMVSRWRSLAPGSYRELDDQDVLEMFTHTILKILGESYGPPPPKWWDPVVQWTQLADEAREDIRNLSWWYSGEWPPAGFVMPGLRGKPDPLLSSDAFTLFQGTVARVHLWADINSAPVPKFFDACLMTEANNPQVHITLDYTREAVERIENPRGGDETLGAFVFDRLSPSAHSGTNGRFTHYTRETHVPRVELYMLRIRDFAKQIGVPLHHLFRIVLCHELAHYSHLTGLIPMLASGISDDDRLAVVSRWQTIYLEVLLRHPDAKPVEYQWLLNRYAVGLRKEASPARHPAGSVAFGEWLAQTLTWAAAADDASLQESFRIVSENSPRVYRTWHMLPATPMRALEYLLQFRVFGGKPTLRHLGRFPL